MVLPVSTVHTRLTLYWNAKRGAEIIPAAFTDHHVVVLRLRINDCRENGAEQVEDEPSSDA
jgi:hypothetical protein